ncbi:MAG: hypothetical protein QOI57_2639 [Rubrobacteraceae bacterium]|jgi:hypothetical protein|nr:hypothetical protein [Rubrobacteraceae bacterium]
MGFSFGAASIQDQTLAEPFFAMRHRPTPWLSSVGAASSGLYVVDKGFEGKELMEKDR